MGYWCPECVREAEARVRSAKAPYGGALVEGALVTMSLITMNVVAYVLTALNSAGGFASNYASSMFGQLALWTPAIAAHQQYWRLLTSMFLHFGPFHLLVNMIALAVVGNQLEVIFGRARYLAVYLVAGLGGSVAVYLLQAPGAVTAGASGALFGLFGAVLVVVRRLRANPRPILFTIVLNLVVTFLIPNISKWAHIGGLVTGVALAAVIVYAPAGKNRSALQVSGVGVIVAVLATLVVLRTGQLVG